MNPATKYINNTKTCYKNKNKFYVMLKEKQKLLKNPYSGCINIGYIQLLLKAGIFEKKEGLFTC